MTPLNRQLKAPAIVSTILVLPFIALELANSRGQEPFPLPLFVLMWLLAVAFGFILLQILRSPRSSLVQLIPGVALLALLAVFWLGMVADQMPCFLGTPNCD